MDCLLHFYGGVLASILESNSQQIYDMMTKYVVNYDMCNLILDLAYYANIDK